MMRSRWLYLLVGSLLVGAVIFVAIYAEQITPASPYYMDERATILEGRAPFPPGGAHPLGTDEYGRDIWSRVAYGTRWSLLFAGLIMAGRLLLAFPMGIAAAFGPRFFGWLVGRLYVFTSAIPPLVIYLAVLSVPRLRYVGLWPSIAVTVALLTLVEWPRVAVYIQGRLEELSGEHFIEGAVAAGASRLRIFTRHMMPHLWATFFQLVASEMGRGLLVIAQLGIFGIWVGGGIIEVVGYPPQRVLITGIPEWGALLSEARNTIRNTPWIPMTPAMAFLVGVVGFHMLSQGLDGLSFNLYRFREATTGRISARRRLLLIPLILAPVLYWWQVRTRDDATAFAALAERQTAALNNRDLEGYLATLATDDPDYAAERRRWLEQLLQTDFQVVVSGPVKVSQRGNRATGDWMLSFGYENLPPVTSIRAVMLNRRDGQWYEGRGDFQRLRGFHTDTYAQYNPIDGSAEIANLRWEIRKVSTVVDRAFVNALASFPTLQKAPPRPRVIYFRNANEYDAVIDAADQGSRLSYVPGEAVRVSPRVLNPFEPYELEKNFTRTLISVLTADGLGRQTADPLAAGLYERKAGVKGSEFWLNIYKLEGRLATLPELMNVPIAALKDTVEVSYYTQAAVLVQYLQGRIDPGLLRAGLSAADLAQMAGVSEADLTAGYASFLKERIMMESMLSRPEWRGQVDMGVVEAMNRRAAAVADQKDDLFAQMAVGDELQAAQATWLNTARAAGLAVLEADLLDFRVKGTEATVLALERYKTGNGWYSAVVSQTWQKQADGWKLSAWSGPDSPSAPWVQSVKVNPEVK
jgi:ABC-type dipeptide/oligopeptide/nickel transport system permease subunit